ncbi:MAG: hypothetical protein DI527_08215 [Chelatococcus sp.]|nr:MAG: hypothetical protein DI527_08215 [Chelatococcus sp.]
MVECSRGRIAGARGYGDKQAGLCPVSASGREQALARSRHWLIVVPTSEASVPPIRNLTILLMATAMSFGALLLSAAILGHLIPLSASEALNGRARSAHELGFWMLLLLSLPLWVAGAWLSAAAVIRNRRGNGIRRRATWAAAIVVSALAMAAISNTLGFGDLFKPD